MTAVQIIIEPVLTEKANRMRDEGKYVFRVDPAANKPEIMRAVKELFSVHPIACNVIRVGGKPKKLRYRAGYTSSYKKAIVTVSKGEKIAMFEGA
jgi:large subunit ribosomal protein L23